MVRKSDALATESVTCLNGALAHLRNIWEEIGIPEDQRLQRTEVVKKHIKGLLDMMIAEEENLRQRLKKSIDMCQKELHAVCQELNLAVYLPEEDCTMLQLEKDLRTRLEVLLKQKKERMLKLKSLKDQDEELCDILCATAYPIDADAVPSLEQLDAFQEHIASLNVEKERRRAEFVETKRNIILCMEELDQLPDTSFERDIVCEDEDAFCLSNENIIGLKTLLQQLEVKRSQNESKCSELRNQIINLWDWLQISQEERDTFSANMVGSRAKTMQALQTELERLEVLKQHNMKNVIESVRRELATHWEKCFFSSAQRQEFAPYYDEDYTEELLQLHNLELNRLKEYYQTHQQLFEGIWKWEENWKLYLSFEKKAADPNRFTNRGGNLLKEEKQRTKLCKMLPKLEEELKIQIAAWEQEHHSQFQVNGQNFMGYVTEQWELHKLEKEREKQERQLKKNKLIEEEMLYGSAPKTPNKRRLNALNTPGKLRKLNGTSIANATPNSTLRCAIGSSVCYSPISRPPLSGHKPGQPVRTPGYSATKPPRLGLVERNKENISHLNATAMSGASTVSTPQHNLSINSVATTYSEFAMDSAPQ
ncbi:protein regulator of cytokinesis 1b isoform X2 [Chiloscyllium plagiosum]|uniref:protein regulator of cytokinesis 1b isoform X2 n=1 Tax=Chiloscyllium plagiosum TaxID=36176 RepID=UPI001CB86375|nr:protein regulator of cytokinesis 1b isoform X2 [Chiloscyllium plagiosum]